jgi:hypothetical protein
VVFQLYLSCGEAAEIVVALASQEALNCFGSNKCYLILCQSGESIQAAQIHAIFSGE